MRRAYLFADPASHSRSPAMHTAAFAWAGIDGHYEARRVPSADLGAAIAGLRAPDVLGANLSLPHKEAALAHLDALTPAARAIGAVNTIVQDGGRLTGDNTDAPGLLLALAAAGDPGGPALVLGAGGAARAAVWALLGQRREVWIWNRTREKADALAADLGARASDVHDLPWRELGLLVNATSAGLSAPDASPLPHAPDLAPGALVYDMVYQPPETRLMREARALGLPAENGLTMLAQQARLAFALWTGVQVPVTVFLNAL